MSTDASAPFAAADAVLVVHAAFVGFVVLGQLYVMLGWARRWSSARNRLFRHLHLIAIGVVVLQSWLGLVCPLTLLENQLRVADGEWAHGQSFIGYWLSRLLYYHAPSWVFTVGYTLFASVVVLCYIGYPPKPGKERVDDSK